MTNSHLFPNAHTSRKDNGTSQLRISALERRIDVLSNVYSAWKLSFHQHLIESYNSIKSSYISEYKRIYAKLKKQKKGAKPIEIPLSHITGFLPCFVGNITVCSHFNYPLQTLYMALSSSCKNNIIIIIITTRKYRKVIISSNNFKKFWTVFLWVSILANTNKNALGRYYFSYIIYSFIRQYLLYSSLYRELYIQV